MNKKRVFEVAKELGLSSKEVIDYLAKNGIQVKSHMAAISDEEVTVLHKATASKEESQQKIIIPATVAAIAKPAPAKATSAVKPYSTTPVPKVVEVPKPSSDSSMAPTASTEAPVVPTKIEVIEILNEEKKEEPKKEEITAPAAAKLKVKISEGVTVGELASKMNLKAVELIKRLMTLKVMATINQRLDPDVATMMAEEHGFEVEFIPLYGEDLITEAKDKGEEGSSLQVPRAPVITIMGHVDHGKTSLLDAIRQTNVMGGEAGGITQHIGAYKVHLQGKGDVVFLDTPGHEAFTAMRARGASITDVIVLVVSADDGVMPQTIEAINHARAASLPIIVAINKIDKENANINRVKQQLSEYGLLAEDWGGKTIMVEVSAKKKINLDKLLEMLLLEAEMLELRGNPSIPAKGTILEAKLDKGRGAVATVLVENGILKVGDAFIAGAVYGKVRALIDDKGKRLLSAGPATPVEILGLSGVPQAGDNFQVVINEKLIRNIANRRQELNREHALSLSKRVTLEDLFSQIQQGDVKELKIIIKADVSGSVEVLTESLEALSSAEKVRLHVIHGAVGSITESDVMLASTSNAIIVGFNVRPEPKAEEAAGREKVDIRCYRIIYEIINDVKAAMEGLLDPHYKEVLLGRVEVRKIFKVSKEGTIAGCYVTSGKVVRSARSRIVRDGVVVFDGKLSSLKRFKDDVSEVMAGFECGTGFESFNDIKPGDVIESYEMEAVAQKL